MQRQRLRFLDVFSGIGGFRMGLESLGHECIGHIEINKHSRTSYKAIYDIKESEVDYKDVTEVTDKQLRKLRGKVDILCGGFPCQAFSIAGNRRGFKDTRGTMFFELARIAEQVKPPYLLFENVKGLLSHDKGQTFEVILQALDDIGYDCEWQVLNSKNFGVPQNRERVYIVGHLRGSCTGKIFPIGGRYGETKVQIREVAKWSGTNRRTGQQILSSDGLSPCITTNSYGVDGPKFVIPIKNHTSKGYLNAIAGDGINFDRINDDKRRGRVCKGLAQTMTCKPTLGVVTLGGRIRRLTPRECWRLQGFPDWAFDKAKGAGVSERQLYIQAGNAVTVNVIRAIGERMYIGGKDEC